MAVPGKVLKSYDFPVVRVGGFAPRFDWSSLLDGKIRRLVADDLPAGMEPAKFRNSLRKAAAKKGFKISANIEVDEESGEFTGLVVGSTPMTDEEKTEYASHMKVLKAKRKAAKAARKAKAAAEANGENEDEDDDDTNE